MSRFDFLVGESIRSVDPSEPEEPWIDPAVAAAREHRGTSMVGMYDSGTAESAAQPGQGGTYVDAWLARRREQRHG